MFKQYLYRVSILNRKNSHPLEAISYYSGEDQTDINNLKNYISNTKDIVLWNGIILPDKQSSLYTHLPEYLKFRKNKNNLISNARNILWQNVFINEKRDDAQFSRLFEVSMPYFLTLEQTKEAIIKFATNLVNEGMIADCSIHSRKKDQNNYSLIEKLISKNKIKTEENKNLIDYTGYLMCTLRTYKNGKFCNKNREWNDKKKMELWRYKWVKILTETINNADVPTDQKNIWEKKLNIYSEYKNIKNELLNKKTRKLVP